MMMYVCMMYDYDVRSRILYHVVCILYVLASMHIILLELVCILI